MHNSYVLSCVVLFLAALGCGWDLASIGIAEFSVKHVTIHKSRAFLTIESDNASLVEATWPENKAGVRLRILSDYHNAPVASCNGLKNVISTDIDSAGRIWILDRGDVNGYCSAKLVIRSLILVTNKEIRHDFSRCSRVFNSIVVDPFKASDGDTRAFLTLVDTDYLLFFSLFKQAFGKLKFEKRDFSPISPISLSEVAINQNRLYISDSLTGRLFSLPVKTIRQLTFPEHGVEKMILKTNVTYLGRLLGRATGLRLDLWDNLYYIIPRDGAVVKWKPGRSLTAENHLVIFQREINVSQVVLGVANKVWIIASRFVSDQSKRHCLRINK